MLKDDELTSIYLRSKFSRIYVELDLITKLVLSFSALEKDIKLECEKLHQICFKFGRFGLKIENCDEFMGDILTKMVETTVGDGQRKKNGDSQCGVDTQKDSLEEYQQKGKEPV
ncbi:hypothetical protein Ahy_A04g020572 [Arachis hypogaea]|uniref:Uncharacterized protein n=1 Tax=Arachis hypogaea TaxID=3818 RepID=A0A445DI76_ARAHY|nr:hypothetical protein Ahy_A04g020572 [Arachis hypogaea]